MNIFIIGASGLIGGNCLHHFKQQGGVNVVGSYFSYKAANTVFFDTLKPQNLQNYDIKSFKPDVIIHCGALTYVDHCETHEAESYEKTVQSTQNVIQLCKQLNAKMVYLSTDYVFDGKEGPYDEAAKVNPLSIYGKHKLEAESAIQKELSDYLIIRITNPYGDEERNKNFVARIVEKLKAGEALQLTLPFDQYATPTNALDIAKAIFLLLKDNKRGIYHIANTDYMNRPQLAQSVLDHFPNAKAELTPISTKELNQPAKRPLKGGLISAKFLKEYPDFRFSNVDEYLKEF